MDESEEAGSELIETGGDPSELLELEEEGFRKMALLVKPPIDVPRIGIILLWWNTKIRVVVGNKAVFKIFCKRANCDAQMIPGA